MTTPPGANNGVGIIIVGDAATKIPLRDKAMFLDPRFADRGSLRGRVRGLGGNKNRAHSVHASTGDLSIHQYYLAHQTKQLLLL